MLRLGKVILNLIIQTVILGLYNSLLNCIFPRLFSDSLNHMCQFYVLNFGI